MESTRPAPARRTTMKAREALNNARALLALVAALVCGQALALSSDSDKPIKLNADEAVLNNATGVGIYRGDVVLTQGTLEVTGDVMRVYTNDQRQVTRIEVEGAPATYRQLPDDESEYVRARAPRMEYYAAGPERIRLLGGATLWQGRNEFKGETIVYNVASESVQADSGQKDDSRIEITLFPNRDQQQENGDGGSGRNGE